jgi:hypothetical protein
MRQFVSVVLATSLLACGVASAGDRAGPEPAASRVPITSFPVVYQITGLRDDGGASNLGVATTIHCSNPTRFPAQVQFVTWQFNGAVVNNKTFTITRDRTFTASTHLTSLYAEDVSLATGPLLEGFMQIYSDNAQLLCSAEVLDASPNMNFVVGLPARSARGE